MNSPIINILGLVLLAPLISSMAIILLTRKVLFKAAGIVATVVMAAAFAASCYAAVLWNSNPPATALTWNIPWIPIPGTAAGHLYLGIMVDGLTIAMMTMVTGIATLVHLYSIGYMEGDKRYNRFFAYLSLFTFSMLGIVLSNSILMLFVFWELVGMTSYLLIGFWFEKRGPQLASKKAFVMNRVGDMGFLIGFGILFYKLGGQLLLPAVDGQNMFVAMGEIIKADGHSLTNPPLWLTGAGIGLFFGAIGKSAQFPLHTWLPDAMEGPTPVSSIVHSATMVAAGVYLTARIYPILTPGAHLFIATIGLITLVIAACMALVMHDIKRVLAYSTLSQLGYMILGLGAGAWSFALFHLITHAFFKCCLFQCSGSVIHAAHHQQDMRYYGGLGKKMPITFACYIVCTLAIAGASIPGLKIGGEYVGMSGFYSKDGIIAGTINYGESMASIVPWAHLFFWGPTVVAYLTVFYMTRSLALTFLGKPRDQHLYDNAHEAPWQMVAPQVVLAIMAFAASPLIMPMWINLINSAKPDLAYVQPGHEKEMEHAFHLVHAFLLHGVSWILMIALGIAIFATQAGNNAAAKFVALPGVSLIHKWLYNKLYFDALYDVFTVNAGKTLAIICSAFDKYIVDGIVNLTGGVTKVLADLSGRFDTGVVDGAVNGAAQAARSGGSMLRSTQPGRVRVYVLGVFASACVAILIVVVVAIVTK